MLGLYRDNQQKVKEALEGAVKFDQYVDWEELTTSVNGIILEAIAAAEGVINNQKKLAAMAVTVERAQSQTIDAMIVNKDVFSLICTLRAHGEKRLDSAIALMKFARDAEEVGEDGKTSLRDEIRSTGGVHSLLYTVPNKRDRKRAQGCCLACRAEF